MFLTVLDLLIDFQECFFHLYQDLLFQKLVLMFWNSNAGIQNATRDSLLRLNVTLSLSFLLFLFCDFHEEYPWII